MAFTWRGGLAVAAIVALGACHPVRTRHGPAVRHEDAALTVPARLQCPEEEGALRRVSAAPDGASCDYQGREGSDVTLRLLPLAGAAPDAALSEEEARLKALVPAPRAPGPISIDAGRRDGRDAANIDLPGLHIRAEGDKADVRILGMDIHGEGDHADIKAPVGDRGAVIHAGPGGAEIRAGDVGRRSADLMYLLAGEGAGPGGYKVVGYIARGPVAGPLVVGEFRSRRRGERMDRGEVRRLVDLNVREVSGSEGATDGGDRKGEDAAP